MKLFLKTILIVLIFVQINFGHSIQAKNTKIGHVFYLDIPNSMVRTTSLNNSAIIQYMNEILGTYLIVIDENKEEIQLSGGKFNSPKEYFDFFLDGFKTDETEVLSNTAMNINNHNAYQSEISSMLDTIKIYYLITIIETDEYFYNIISWSLFDNKDKFKEEFIKIADSFKEE